MSEKDDKVPSPEILNEKQEKKITPGPGVSNILDPEDADYVGPPQTVDKQFTYSNRGRDVNGVYLDDIQRRDAEIQRAKVEGREPDLENPGSTQGTPLFLASQVRSNLPGDVVVTDDVTLPVVVGVSPENLKYNGGAKHALDVAKANGVEL
jgi:hypothetical protein